MPLAQISALNPGGNLNLSIGISFTGVTVFRPASGASLELAWSTLRPCCHAGGGAAAAAGAAGAAAAGAAGVALVVLVDWHAASASNDAAIKAILSNMVVSLFLLRATSDFVSMPRDIHWYYFRTEASLAQGC